ncbi:MAG: hypothetical protein ABI678_27360 [Kofleriaceae bacterium]
MTSPHLLTVLAAHDVHTSALAVRLDPTASELVLFDDREHFATQLTDLARTLPQTERTLDLVGYTGPDKLLVFHDRTMDTRIGRVRAYYRGLADHELLPRLGVTMVRLVGCTTAIGDPARRTLAMLSEILGLEVTGTTELVSAQDLGPAGFVPPTPAPWAPGRLLDLDTLATAPAVGAREVSLTQARALLALVRRDAGHDLPCLLALPHARLALPAASGFHHLELLLDHEYVRAGNTVWPVDDPRALRSLLER